jgi:hypothetical protein
MEKKQIIEVEISDEILRNMNVKLMKIIDEYKPIVYEKGYILTAVFSDCFQFENEKYTIIISINSQELVLYQFCVKCPENATIFCVPFVGVTKKFLFMVKVIMEQFKLITKHV